MKSQRCKRPKRGRGVPRPIEVRPRSRASLSASAQRLLGLLEARGAAGEVRLRDLQSEMGGIQPGSISIRFRELQEAGFVRVTRRGHNLPNLYELTEPTVAA